MSHTTSRREFLQRAAAAAAGATAMAALAAPAPARTRSPNERLDLAIIGVAGRGGDNMNAVASENIVALCDIDQEHLSAAAARFPQARTYTDYRKLLDAEKLDAVVVSTPDHTHAIPVVWALERGLDVYCEKPLAHSVYEVRVIREMTAKHKAVTQMGTQIHAGDNYRRVVEIVQAGILGPVRRVHVWLACNPFVGTRVSEGTPPPHVDYDLWIGPAPMRPFHASHFHFNWRFWWDFGNGWLGDFGCHYMDLPFWALGLRYPTSVEAKGEKVSAGDNEIPDNMRVDYHFPARGELPAVHLTWWHGTWRPEGAEAYPQRSAVLFEGERGRLIADYNTHQVMLDEGLEFERPEPTIPPSIGHHAEWIHACKTRGETTCNFDYSGALTEAVLLGNVSYRLGGLRLEWDAERLAAANCPEAEPLINRKYREGWSLT
jgi:predicted dehydrogenase